MSDLQRLCEYLERADLLVTPKRLPREYYYASLPLCVVDAVFSIGIAYRQTEKVVQNVGIGLSVPVYRQIGSPIPHGEQPSVSEFLRLIGDDAEAATSVVFQDRHRTSPTNGILKTEAVMQFCQALVSHGFERFADIADGKGLNEAREAIVTIKGQGSGVSWSYFLMLAGDDHRVKPDRMVIRFVERATRRQGVTPAEAEALVIEAAQELSHAGVAITPRQLDYIIWDYQRSQPRHDRFGGEMLPAAAMVQLSGLIKDGTVPISNRPGEDD